MFDKCKKCFPKNKDEKITNSDFILAGSQKNISYQYNLSNKHLCKNKTNLVQQNIKENNNANIKNQRRPVKVLCFKDNKIITIYREDLDNKNQKTDYIKKQDKPTRILYLPDKKYNEVEFQKQADKFWEQKVLNANQKQYEDKKSLSIKDFIR